MFSPKMKSPVKISSINRSNQFLTAFIFMGLIEAGAAIAQEMTLVSLSSLNSVESIELLPDGSVKVFLVNGQQIVLSKDQIQISATGEVFISQDLGDRSNEFVEVVQDEHDSSQIILFGLALGLLGAGVATMSGSSSGHDDGEGKVPDAVIAGVADGIVVQDTAPTLTTTETLTVSDNDAGEAVLLAQTGTAGSGGYGSFDLGTDGVWIYTADSSQAVIQQLAQGETLTDSFTAVATDGTTQLLPVTITGNSDAIELSEVEQDSDTRGFAINGVSAGDRAGLSVASAGDINGDGFDDLIIGAPNEAPNGPSSGASFVVFGKTDGTAVELSDIEAGTGGFAINCASASDKMARMVRT